MSAPEVYVGHEVGQHNKGGSAKRIKDAKTYRDLSTVCVIATRGLIHARVVESWWSMMIPMNQKFTRVTIKGMEVGDAYNYAVEMILSHPDLQNWKYMLTLEEDNLPPPDGLLRLYESIDDYDVIGGLYWTKGEMGQPMIYGDPTGILNFVPQVPKLDTVQECCGLGMGFNLFNLDLFRSGKLEKPWFKTVQEWDPERGGQMYTQDLYFYERAKRAGYRVACDTRIKVGHIDSDGFVW